MADLLRVSILGLMPSGEEWSTNPTFAIGGDFGEAVTAIQAQAIAVAIAALDFPSDLRNCMATSCSMNSIRVEARNVDGTLEALGEANKGTAMPGQSTTPHPFQAALVSSLRTAHAGASGRGRLYWVATGVPLTVGTLRPVTSFTGSVASSVAAYLAAIATAAETVLTGAVTPAVWSRKNNALYPVTTVQIGDVLDVQRRRRDALVETVMSAPIP